jgi:L-threonylcarbamoyladenylate synthase
MKGEKMIYNVFKDIPDVAWQIINLYDKPTALILYKPRNLTPNLITADNTLGILIVKNLSVSS